MMYWMFFKITYCTYYGVKETTDTIDGASFFIRFFISSYPDKKSKYRMISFMHPNTTAGFMCERRGITLSITLKLIFHYIYAYASSLGLYLHKKSNKNTCAHSIHSFKATSNLLRRAESILMCYFPSKIWISSREAIALANTKALPYLTIRA